MSFYILRSLTTVSRITAKNLSPRIPVHRMATSTTSTPGDTSSSANTGKLKVEHNTESQEFYIKLTDGEDENSKAVLQYSFIRPDYIDLEHTVVPPQFRGHGIAKVLAQTAFDHFVEKGSLIRPTCTYLQKFYNENPLPRYKEKVKWD